MPDVKYPLYEDIKREFLNLYFNLIYLSIDVERSESRGKSDPRRDSEFCANLRGFYDSLRPLIVGYINKHPDSTNTTYYEELVDTMDTNHYEIDIEECRQMFKILIQFCYDSGIISVSPDTSTGFDGSSKV